MQREPNSLALRMPFHFAGLAGGFQRRSLTGGLAKGMPRNAVIVPSDLPSSLPVSIFTVGAESAARLLTPANKAARSTALAAEERPSLIEESPGEPGGQYHSERARENRTAKLAIWRNVILDVIRLRGLGSKH